MRRGFSLLCAVVGLSVVAARAEEPKKPPKPQPQAVRGADLEREADRIRARIGELERHRDALIEKERLEPDHPRIRQLDQTIEPMRRRLEDLQGRAEHVERQGMRPLPPDRSAEHGRPRPPSPEPLQMQRKGPFLPQPEPLLERLRHERPDVHARLMYLRETDPDAFHKELGDLGPLPPPPPDRPASAELIAERIEAREMDELRRHDPERFELIKRDEELTRRTIEFAERARRVGEAEQKDKLTKELKELLDQQFDVRMQIRRLEIKDLARRLDELNAGLERRIKRKPELIERRMNELLRPEETEW